MKTSRAFVVAVGALSLFSTAWSSPSDVCDSQALTRAYIDMVNAEYAASQAGAKCVKANPPKPTGDIWTDVAASIDGDFIKDLPKTKPASETETRLKLCADAGSATRLVFMASA